MAEQRQHDYDAESETRVVTIQPDGHNAGLDENNCGSADYEATHGAPPSTDRSTTDEHSGQHREEKSLAHRCVVRRVQEDRDYRSDRAADTDDHESDRLCSLDVDSHGSTGFRVVARDVGVDSIFVAMEDQVQKNGDSGGPEHLRRNWAP